MSRARGTRPSFGWGGPHAGLYNQNKVAKTKKSKRYDVALSFAGEDRAYVRKVADFLRGNGARVFYDEFEQVRLWGTNLVETLQGIYQQDSEFVVIFISAAYRDKQWTRHELRSAMAAALENNRELVLPARFDETELDGWLPTVAYIDLKHLTPGEFGALVLNKLAAHGLQVSGAGTLARVPDYTIWRVTREKYSRDLSGMGGLYAASRFAQRGVPVIYASSSLCTAVMQALVHLTDHFPSDYVSVRILIPTDVPIRIVYSVDLQGTNEQALGTAWIASGETCVLSAPSALIPEDRIYVLNPVHPDIKRIRLGEIQPLHLDPRLFGRQGM